MIRLSPQFRSAVQRGLPPILVALSIAFIILGKADHGMLDPLRTEVTDTVAPALALVSRPLAAAGDVVHRVQAVVAMYEENLRLEQDNERLLHWQQDALQLASENRQLRALLKLVPDHARSYMTVRVIANSGGAYVRSLMINAGSDDGLARGQAAITGDGLVGRLTEVGDRAARVLLITDLNSRIPVTVGRERLTAVLAGDNSERPRLIYLPVSANVKPGERVVTSGEGGVFPPGLPVGVVVSLSAGQPRVEPFVELSQVGYLRIVDYGLSEALPKPISAGGRCAVRPTPFAVSRAVAPHR